ncbi:dihydrolipoyllysine succinyltransferase [Tsukamurella tyrosinosolvens]|nr:dihydrolipoyllysine succinyltransferase [Tsukamurella tyrosinosolvens]
MVLPPLGEAVEQATVARWLKEVGDTVIAGEPLLEVSTDKVDTEVPSPASGVLREILVPDDSVVSIGSELAVIGGSQVDAKEAEVTVAEPNPKPEREPVVAAGSDLGPEPSPAIRTEKLPRIRRTIAKRMVESLQTAAQLTTVVEVDLSEVALLRSRLGEEFHRSVGVKLSYLPFVAKAAVDALAEHPVINASVNADCSEVSYYAEVDLGIAVDSPGGLMVPVIRNAGALDIAGYAVAIADLAEAVRGRTISVDQLTGGTFTVTNTGSRGALFDTPIINQPQSAILGVGAVVERLVPLRGPDGSLVITARRMAYLALSYDHRLVDGADAARYLASVRHRLESGFDDSQVRP